MSYSYSTDEEHFYGDYETTQEAVIAGFKNNPDHDVIFVGAKRKLTAHDFINARSILEQINEEACDEGPESAADWLFDGLARNKDKCIELEKLIGDWIEANEPVKFFTVDDVNTVNK